MTISNYYPLSNDYWSGRVDSSSDYDAFRWHQWIETIDLRAYNKKCDTLGFCILGFCSEAGVLRNKGRAGTSKGPETIRKQLANLPCHFTQKVKLFDAGNIICNDMHLESVQDALSKAVEKILSCNLFPILLGGGHGIALGHYKGLSNYYAKNNSKLGILNFDAHFDLRPYKLCGSSGTMFLQIADFCKNQNIHYDYMCVGIQKRSNTIALFKTAKNLNVKYILAKDMVDQELWPILEKIDNFIKNQDHIYITICADVFSAAFAPGVSAPSALGLNPEQVIKILKYILRSGKSVSFDIAEVSPRFDKDHTTANLAAVLIFSLVNTLSEINGYNIDFI